MKFLILSILVCCAAHAENVKQVLFQKGDWNVSIIENHRSTGKTACVGSVTSKDQQARLELYAEASTISDYVNPIVHISMAGADTKLGGSLDSGKNTPSFWLSTALKDQADLNAQYVSILQDRKKIIDMLVSANSARASLKEKGGQAGKLYEFSLKGSESTISKFFELCKVQKPN